MTKSTTTSDALTPPPPTRPAHDSRLEVAEHTEGMRRAQEDLVDFGKVVRSGREVATITLAAFDVVEEKAKAH